MPKTKGINTREIISAAQIDRIERLSSDCVRGSTFMHHHCRQTMGASLLALTRTEARRYIAMLERERDERREKRR